MVLKGERISLLLSAGLLREMHLPVQGHCFTSTAGMAKTELHRKLWSISGTTREDSDLEAVLGERRIKEMVIPPCHLSLFKGMGKGEKTWLEVTSPPWVEMKW